MKLVEAYRASGVRLPPINRIPPHSRKIGGGRGIVIAPPSAAGTTWINRFGETSLAMVSGWMLLRGVRRRRGIPKGFILSDHVDYPDLMQAVQSSGAQRVLVTHGFTDIVARLLTEQGLKAEVLATRFVGETNPDDSGTDKDASYLQAITREPTDTDNKDAEAAQ